MSRYEINRVLGILESVVNQEFAKIRSVGLKISTKATDVIASFVLSAVLDLIRRADKYRLDRVGDEEFSGEEQSSGEEESSEVGEPLTEDDAIRAYRDLEDSYVLTAADDTDLFSRLSHPNDTIRIRGRERLAISRVHANYIVQMFSHTKEWEDLAIALISLYIEYLSKELLEKSIALADPLSSRIRGDDAKAAVRMRERGIDH